jgi:GDP-4-dehydro-6-deoxy-D-mannose reductase
MAVWMVTGATGFIGRHVLDALASGAMAQTRLASEVIVLGRHRPRHWPEESFVEADLDDSPALAEAMRRIAPDFVIHTAGKTPPAGDEEIFRANFWSTTHLLTAIRKTNKPVRVILSGSAAELGVVRSADLPVGEDYPADPIDAYGRSKLMATRSGLAERPPLEVVTARIFNAIGPGLPASQAFGRFATRLAEPGPDPLELTVGDLEARRDFIDVRDVAEAMIALALRGRSGLVYHVGTGRSRAVGEGLEALKTLSQRSVNIRADPALLRKSGPADSRAAPGRIFDHTGWQPRIAWEQTLIDLWNDVAARPKANPWNGDVSRPALPLPLTA